MKKTVLIIVMSVLQTVVAFAQIPYPSTDTLPCGERQRNYFYSEWFDTLDFYLRPDCYSYSSPEYPMDFNPLWDATGDLPGWTYWYQQFAPRRLRIKGLWAMVRQYPPANSRIKDSTRLPEYLYLGMRAKEWPYPSYSTYDKILDIVDSARWDTAQPKMMCLKQTADGRKRNLYCHVYEALFDTVYTVSGEFWIGGSSNSNEHTYHLYEHWPTIYMYSVGYATLFGNHRPNMPYNYSCEYRVSDGLWGGYHHHGIAYPYFGVILDEQQYYVRLLSDDAARGIAKHTAYYPAGSHQTITAVASPCYHFSHWNDGDTTNPRTILVTQDTTFTAYFDTVANIYEVAARSNDLDMGRAVLREWPICDSTPRNDPNNPSFTQDSLCFPEYRVIGTDTAYCEGDSAIFWARPRSGYYFWYWNDSVRENPRTILVTQDTVLTAIFKQEEPPAYVRPCPRVGKPLAVEMDTGRVLLTWGWGRNVLHEGWELAWGLAGTPPDSCEIISCSGFDREIGGLDTGVRYAAYVRGLCMPGTGWSYYSDWSDSVEIYFHYPPNRYTVTAVADYQERGRVYGGGVYGEGTVVMLTANAWNPYSFLQWDDGDTSNPRYVVVTQDTSFTAQFVEPEPPEGVATADGAGSAFKLLPNPASGSVLCVFDREAIAGGVLAMTDATGRELMRHELAPLTASLRLDLSTLPAGTYFVTLATPQGSSTQKLILE